MANQNQRPDVVRGSKPVMGKPGTYPSPAANNITRPSAREGTVQREMDKRSYPPATR